MVSNEDGSFNQLVTAIGAWCEGPFAAATERGQIRRLHQEIDELSDAIRADLPLVLTETKVASEMADVIMVLFHMAHRRDINLFAACMEKWRVNQLRQWHTDPEGDSVSHIRESLVPGD